MNHVFIRAVILPATALLLPGAAGAADPLRDLRLAACATLATLAESGPPLVLAPGPAGTRGPGLLCPSLAAAGIADGMLPDDVVAPWVRRAGGPVAGTAASVLLLCLSMALGARAADVPVLEVPADGTGGPEAVTGAVRDHVDRGGTLVLGSGGAPGPGTVAPADPGALVPALSAVPAAAGVAERHAVTRTFACRHDHLPAAYPLVTYPHPAAQGVAP